MSLTQHYHLFLADMKLHGILTFSSEIKPAVAGIGAVHITSHFLHNYALIYAFNNKIAESYVTIPSMHLALKRKHLKESLKYTFISKVLKEIRRNQLRHIYAFPAYPAEVTTKKFFLSAKGYGYVERARTQIKNFYPTETNWVSLVPPTRHITILLSPRRLPRTLYIRIGMKRTGIYRVDLHEIRLENIRKINGLEWSSIPVNLYDVKLFGYMVEEYTKVLETRSVSPDKPDANIIGYIRSRGLYEIRSPQERIIAPLPEMAIK